MEGRPAGEDQVERRIVSVLFADLVGFTTLSEQLDPEDIATVQDAYFAAVRETIGRYGGRLEKFIGDAAMAVFGVPKARDEDAARAVRAGLALVSAVDQLGAKVGLGEGELRVRVGVNTGEVVHAEAGPEEGRVTGDTVNVAARLQAAAPPGGVLVGETTALAVAEVMELEPVGALELKGKAEPVRASLATGSRPDPSRDHAMGSLRAPILGREDELAQLARALARVARGDSERWVIVAPPGVGKSRLLQEFALRANRDQEPPPAVWRARLRPDLLAPFEPVAQLLRAGLAGRGFEPPTVEQGMKTSPPQVGGMLRERLLTTGVPEGRAAVVVDEALAILFPSGDHSATQPTHTGTGEREARFAAWLEVLESLASSAPSVWILEDVHWAGGDLLAFLDFAAKAKTAAGRLVLATSRPSLLDRAAQWCADDPVSATYLMHLSPLSSTDAGQLIHALVGQALPEELVSAIAERSDGNPLFIEELLRTWISVGTLEAWEGGTWRLIATAEEVALPATVQAIYSAQLDDLPPTARLAARRASVAGRRFPIGVLDHLGVPNPQPAVEILGRRALLAGPWPDALLGGSYQFRHALLRDAGYASLARMERARLHVRLARWLEQAAGDRWAEVAEVVGNHYRAALSSTPSLAKGVGEGLGREETAELAASWFERAAEAALEVAAHDAARTLLRQALDLTRGDALMDLAKRWERLGDATAYAADMSEGAKAFRRAADYYLDLFRDPAVEPNTRARARSGYVRAIVSLGLVLCQQLQFQEAVGLAEAGLRAIGEAQDAETGWLLYLRAWGTSMWSYLPRVRIDVELAQRLARANGDMRLELEATALLNSALEEEGVIGREELLAQHAAVARLAADLGHWSRASQLIRARAMILMAHRPEMAAVAVEESADLASTRGLTEAMAWTHFIRAELLLFVGDWDAATDSALRALDLADRNDYHRAQVRTWFVLVPMAQARGNVALVKRAHRWLDAQRGQMPKSPYGRFMHSAMDLRFAAMGLTAAPPVGDDLLEAWDETQAGPSWCLATEAIVERWIESHPALAGRALDRFGQWRHHEVTGNLERAQEDLLRARLCLISDDLAKAAELSTRALELCREPPAPFWIAKSIRTMAQAGAASSELVEEAVDIERRLKLTGPAA